MANPISFSTLDLIGTILPFAGANAPTGWTLCYGQAVNRTGTYADLFAKISTIYGPGDNSTTFNLPDLRGRVPIGLDNINGTNAGIITIVNGTTLGAKAGEEKVTLQANETALPAHTHGITDPQHNHGFSYSSGNRTSGGTVRHAQLNTTGNVENLLTNTTGISINSSSSAATSAHNNVQPSIIVNYIIKH